MTAIFWSAVLYFLGAVAALVIVFGLVMLFGDRASQAVGRDR